MTYQIRQYLQKFSKMNKFAPVIIEILYQDLSIEAQQTLVLINKNGIFPYPQDGKIFSNWEKTLPIQNRGYYKEYTVITPGVSDRGTKRIITGKMNECYYTDNHYNTFREIIK